MTQENREMRGGCVIRLTRQSYAFVFAARASYTEVIGENYI